MSDLRERVAKEFAGIHWATFLQEADAAIALCMEEAVRACRKVADVAAAKARDYVVDGLIPEARLQSGRVEGADDCAAAIRALGEVE